MRKFLLLTRHRSGPELCSCVTGRCFGQVADLPGLQRNRQYADLHRHGGRAQLREAR
jgi:hypothetical protein